MHGLKAGRRLAEVLAKPGNVIRLDDTTGSSMCIDETLIVNGGECGRVNHIPREPLFN